VDNADDAKAVLMQKFNEILEGEPPAPKAKKPKMEPAEPEMEPAEPKMEPFPTP